MEEKKFIITINREYGTGGRTIAYKLGELLGVKVYDRAILQKLSEHFHLSADEMETLKGRKSHWWDEFLSVYSQHDIAGCITMEVPTYVTSQQLYDAEEQLLQSLAYQESCIIVGRTGFHIFKNEPAALKIMLIASEEKRLNRIMKKFNINKKEAFQRMKEIDRARENFTKTFAEVSRYDARNYDIVWNVGNFEDIESTVSILADIIRKRYNLK